MLDLIGHALAKGIAVRAITRQAAYSGDPPALLELVRLRDWSPFARLNNARFETVAYRHARPDWPTIAISRCPGAEMCIVGGTHLGHLKDRNKKPTGYFDQQMARRELEMYQQARIIVAHSAKVADEIAHFYDVPAARIHTLYPPVDTRLFNVASRAQRKRVRQETGIRPDEFLLLFPSNNHALKGADLIQAALAGVSRRIRLVVAGKAPLAGNNVINLGFRGDMPALYAAADSIILASRYEAFGLVGPEAILCGTPVLFAEAIGAAEVLADEACIRFPRTVEGLQEALCKALVRFDAGYSLLPDPERYIHYPYSLAQHFDRVFELLFSDPVR